MEYIREQGGKEGTTSALDISKLSGEGELTKGAPQMSSFKFYLTKPTAQAVKKEVIDKKKDVDVKKELETNKK